MSDALMRQMLHAGKLMEEMHSWMVKTWDLFFENGNERKRDVQSTSNDCNDIDTLSIDSFCCDTSIGSHSKQWNGEMAKEPKKKKAKQVHTHEKGATDAISWTSRLAGSLL
jgi:hypothetical protein